VASRRRKDDAYSKVDAAAALMGWFEIIAVRTTRRRRDIDPRHDDTN
jgi:hypothetical protein